MNDRNDQWAEDGQDELDGVPDWAYATFGIEGVPYSQVRVPLTREGIAQGVAAARLLADHYHAAFPHQEGVAPAATHATPQAAAPRREGGTGPSRGAAQPTNQRYIYAYCPDPEHRDEHGAPAGFQFSAPRFQPPEGDKVYHPLPEHLWYIDATGRLAKNHNTYWRHTVDAEGFSNQGQPMPFAATVDTE